MEGVITGAIEKPRPSLPPEVIPNKLNSIGIFIFLLIFNTLNLIEGPKDSIAALSL
jgi:hypothetical protein